MPFDYAAHPESENALKASKVVITREYDSGEKQQIRRVFTIGERLIECQNLLEYGEFVAFMELEFSHLFSVRTGWRYISTVEAWRDAKGELLDKKSATFSVAALADLASFGATDAPSGTNREEIASGARRQAYLYWSMGNPVSRSLAKTIMSQAIDSGGKDLAILFEGKEGFENAVLHKGRVEKPENTEETDSTCETVAQPPSPDTQSKEIRKPSEPACDAPTDSDDSEDAQEPQSVTVGTTETPAEESSLSDDVAYLISQYGAEAVAGEIAAQAGAAEVLDAVFDTLDGSELEALEVLTLERVAHRIPEPEPQEEAKPPAPKPENRARLVYDSDAFEDAWGRMKCHVQACLGRAMPTKTDAQLATLAAMKDEARAIAWIENSILYSDKGNLIDPHRFDTHPPDSEAAAANAKEDSAQKLEIERVRRKARANLEGGKTIASQQRQLREEANYAS